MVNRMKKAKLLATAFAAAAFSIGSANAGSHGDMEKCKVVDSHGKGLIIEHKSDCASKSSSCAGHNKAGDADAWILVPKGECDKINKGDLSGVSDEIKAKVDMKDMMGDKMDDMKGKMDDKHDEMHDAMKDKMKKN
jgi:uncharacterized membrane protein